MQKEELARANADTALNGRCDTIAADVEEVRDIANHKVDATTYTAGQAAQDTKINAAQAAANKANTNIGDWETDHPGQTISQLSTSLENKTAANAAKADANAAVIGDWNAEHPGQTIAQEVTRLNGAIPDVSGFVTETTYNQGQAAQNAKITAAQTAANKANTSIGDWDAEHPGKTIAQAISNAVYLTRGQYLCLITQLIGLHIFPAVGENFTFPWSELPAMGSSSPEPVKSYELVEPYSIVMSYRDTTDGSLIFSGSVIGIDTNGLIVNVDTSETYNTNHTFYLTLTISKGAIKLNR